MKKTQEADFSQRNNRINNNIMIKTCKHFIINKINCWGIRFNYDIVKNVIIYIKSLIHNIKFTNYKINTTNIHNNELQLFKLNHFNLKKIFLPALN